MVGWHHQLNGRGFEQASRNSEGQGKLGLLQSMEQGHDLAIEQQYANKLMPACDLVSF